MFTIDSIFKKTFLLIVSIVIGVVLLFSYSMVTNQKTALLDVLFSKANTIVKSIALVSSDALVTDDSSFIVEHVQKVLEDNDEIMYIVVGRKDGQIIYNNSKHWELLEKEPQLISNFGTNEIKSDIILGGYTPDAVFHLNFPVIFSGIQWGWISIGLSLEQYEKSMQRIYQDSTLLILAMLVAATFFTYVITAWIVKPILLLNKAARKIADGDLSVKVDIEQKGEIGELASSFNYMTSALRQSDLQLRSYNDELEARVNERTEELNLLNKQLDHRVKEEVLKRAEQEQILIQQSRFAAMGEMIGNIAHQWRQPLNAIGLLMQNIEFAHESDSLDDAYIKRVVDKGNKLTTSMSQTIDDFRNFFKPNKDLEIFSFSKAYESTIAMIGSSIENNGITIEEDIDKDVCTSGFASEFSQVLLNIFNNAKDALIENNVVNKHIFIKIYKENGNAILYIKDNAGGIPEDILEKIFDPYFTTKDEGKGTGIGLYMSKTIIENNMNGTLKVHNSEEGACFSISMKHYSCSKDS